MRKADKEEFYRLIDSMNYLLESNKVLSKKDVHLMINELIVMKLKLESKSKALKLYWED